MSVNISGVHSTSQSVL